MPNSGLFGPYYLTNAAVDVAVKGVGPGAYALGAMSQDGRTFIVGYVGRSDSDLNARLKCHVGNYTHFKHAFYPSAYDAFVKECHLFHDFGATALDNEVHPARAKGSNWKCPRCNACG